MLSRSQRLSGEQLDSVMEKGRVTHSSFFWLRLLKYEGNSRFAAIVPHKVVKKATGRNALKRKMYEAIRPLLPKTSSGYLVVVCAKTPAVGTEQLSISKEMNEIFVKSGLMK